MEHELIIGKYTLESLTNGMYASPLDLYREYIQNAVDSIDIAVNLQIEKKENLGIVIKIDDVKKNICIYDNGCGIEKDKAVATLIDIGNSAKIRNNHRGFRGIGRLAGLGYCGELVFTTSAINESVKTIIRFNAKLLKEMLLAKDQDNVSVNDVIEKIVSVETAAEKENKHYFEVSLIDVTSNDGLMDIDRVNDYLIQHAPLPYSALFHWQNLIQEKVRIAGYMIPNYRISLNGKLLFKPYQDQFVSDRVKKITDNIQDIQVTPFYRNGMLSAVLWYAQTSFYGTISDNSIKGIRVRQGNILIGDRTSCNAFFKEERFNGWILGELHVIDPDLIVNSRRDDFEKNDAYYALVDTFREWAFLLSKDIRSISYERSLSKEKKAVVEAQNIEDVNDLCSEDLSFAEDITESDFIDSSESDIVAETDYIGKLSFLLGQKKAQTKYRALNINSKLTADQRKVLERVFDLIQQKYDEADADKFINIIVRYF